MANDSMKYLAVVGVIVVFVIGAAAGMFINTPQASSSEPYHLTLVVNDNNNFNSTVGSQPAFFVLQNGVLTSSANISVPGNKKIELTVMNYDDGGDTVGLQKGFNLSTVLTGTGNNTMLTVTDGESVASQDKNGQEIAAESFYTSGVNASNVSHTFTVLDSNYNVILNIPVEPSSTVTTTVEFTATGTFHWQCYVPCGSGTSGWGGAMSTPGWMEGNVIVS